MTTKTYVEIMPRRVQGCGSARLYTRNGPQTMRRSATVVGADPRCEECGGKLRPAYSHFLACGDRDPRRREARIPEGAAAPPYIVIFQDRSGYAPCFGTELEAFGLAYGGDVFRLLEE